MTVNAHSDEADSQENDAEDRQEMIFPEWAAERIPRKGYTPFSGDQWTTDLRGITYTDKMSGETTRKATTLYGLDAYGRAVYLDHSGMHGRLLYVVPKHHKHFDAPMDADPLTEFPPKHGPSRNYKLNAPDGDVLAVVKQSSKLKLNGWSRSFEKEIVGRAVDEEWEYLAPAAVSTLSKIINGRDIPGRTPNFPYSMAEQLIEDIGADTDN